MIADDFIRVFFVKDATLNLDSRTNNNYETIWLTISIISYLVTTRR